MRLNALKNSESESDYDIGLQLSSTLSDKEFEDLDYTIYKRFRFEAENLCKIKNAATIDELDKLIKDMRWQGASGIYEKKLGEAFLNKRKNLLKINTHELDNSKSNANCSEHKSKKVYPNSTTDKDKTNNLSSNARTKKCPYCAEEIKAEAIKCRFRNQFLDDNTESDDPEEEDTETQESFRDYYASIDGKNIIRICKPDGIVVSSFYVNGEIKSLNSIPCIGPQMFYVWYIRPSDIYSGKDFVRVFVIQKPFAIGPEMTLHQFKNIWPSK